MSEARHATVRRILGKSYSLSKRVALARMSRRSGPPIVVFTMGKTGSTAIARALADATGERVFQVFRLDADRLRAAERRYIDNQRAARADGRRGSAPFPGAHHLWETEYLLAHRPTPSAPWTVVTTTREPVAQAVSAFFHGRGHEAQREGVPVSLLTEELVRDNWIRRPIRWFDREFAPAFGIDVYAEPFDPAAGHTVMETPSARVLLLRQEDLDVAPAALGAFLGAGRPVPVPARNEAATTDYAPAYREFVGHAQLPSELLDQAYTSRYAQHFYTRSEISRYRERWSDSGR